LDAVAAHSERAMAKGSGSFHLATRMFGRSLREDVWQLYAWCRYCDDEIDGQDHGRGAEALSSEERAARLARLRRETKAALAGKEVSEPAFKAFQHVALEHRLAETWPLEMLDGFAMDVDHVTYPMVESTLRYCWGVAGVVGVMMASIMGVADEAVLRRAQDLGLACQLTNICRDIAEDAANGRVYLPAEVLEKAGLNAEPSDITAAVGTTALFAAASEMLDLADRYYASARSAAASCARGRRPSPSARRCPRRSCCGSSSEACSSRCGAGSSPDACRPDRRCGRASDRSAEADRGQPPPGHVRMAMVFAVAAEVEAGQQGQNPRIVEGAGAAGVRERRAPGPVRQIGSEDEQLER
jgi:phytoene synthase